VTTARKPIVPASWSGFYEETQIPAAVRLGSTLRVTGHTGDRDGVFSEEPEEQIRQTFRNLGETLAAAGATWAAVVELTSYHIGLQSQAEALLRVASDFLDSPYPAWSADGVTELFEPRAVVEISCVAELAD
jgi:enamine deaminase RidA (YjgF/YER057c/UK114 family)